MWKAVVQMLQAEWLALLHLGQTILLRRVSPFLFTTIIIAEFLKKVKY